MENPLLLLAILLLVGAYIFIPIKKSENLGSVRLMTIQDNSLAQASNPNYIRPIYNPQVLACLSLHESGHNPDAIGKAGECGQLQFMPSTFKSFCVDKYGLPDNIWDSRIQFRCADMMLESDLGFHWTTYDRCY